jgi:hypothetical protein
MLLQVYALSGRSLAMVVAIDLTLAPLAVDREVTSHRAQTS